MFKPNVHVNCILQHCLMSNNFLISTLIVVYFTCFSTATFFDANFHIAHILHFFSKKKLLTCRSSNQPNISI